MRRRKDSHDGQGQGQGGTVAGMRRTGRAETGSDTGVMSSPPLPVFLFPSEMVFYSEHRHAHRRVLTLYNPYSFKVTFKMLCTAPSLYQVVEAEGSVVAKSCVDLVVRHMDVSPRNQGRRDRFRLEIRGGGQVGGREIWAELRGGEEEEAGPRGEEAEEEVRRKRRRQGGRRGQQKTLSPLSPLLVPTETHMSTAVRSVSQWVVCVLVAVLCVTVLMLPLHTDSSSVVPRCLHVSANQKLACAYTLGLLTVVFLR